MDPDELLKGLRVLMQGVKAGPDAETIIHGDQMTMVWWRNLAGDIAEKFTDLDEWLSRGGFPPEVWREGPDQDV